MRRGPKPAKSKEAKPAVARNSPKDDSARVRDLEKRLAEALRREAEAVKREAEAQDREAATAEILRVIRSSPSDLQPVFDAIVRNAVTLCGALWGMVWRFDGDAVNLVGHHNLPPEELEELHHAFPQHVGEHSVFAMIRTGVVSNLRDVESASEVAASTRARWRRRGVRSAVTVPM